LIYAVPLAVMFYLIRRVERRGFWHSTGVKREKLAMGFVWVLGLTVVFLLILSAYETAAARAIGENIENIGQRVEEYFARMPDWYLWYLLPAFFILVAPAEELIFRGFILDRFLVKGPALAITASSAMFASLHLWYVLIGRGTWIIVGSIFILGAWFGLAYYKTRNLVAPIVMHGLWNAMLPIRRFGGTGPAYVIGSFLIVASFACLFYLIFIHIRRPRKVERAPPPPPPQRLERAIERMRGMLEELKERRARRELSEEEYTRLSERYEARIRELEEELTRQKARPE